MSNLDSARLAIDAEIEHAKKGLAFYQERIASLERMLVELTSIGGVAGHGATANAGAPKKRGPKPKAASQAESSHTFAAGNIASPAGGKKAGKQKSKKGGAASGGNELPFTGGDYWPNLVTEEKKSASEIFEAAKASLGFTPSKEQIQKLSGRMTFALNALVKANKIQDSGSGRERRFFKE